MRRLALSAAAVVLAATASTGDVSAQPQSAVTADELARHGYNMPAENVMLVLIAHTASHDRPVTCVIHAEDSGLKMEVGEIQPGETKVSGVNAQEMSGRLWIQCMTQAQGRTYSSNNFSSVGRTVAHFGTGAKFVITQNIVP